MTTKKPTINTFVNVLILCYLMVLIKYSRILNICQIFSFN